MLSNQISASGTSRGPQTFDRRNAFDLDATNTAAWMRKSAITATAAPR